MLAFCRWAVSGSNKLASRRFAAAQTASVAKLLEEPTARSTIDSDAELSGGRPGLGRRVFNATAEQCASTTQSRSRWLDRGPPTGRRCIISLCHDSSIGGDAGAWRESRRSSEDARRQAAAAEGASCRISSW